MSTAAPVVATITPPVAPATTFNMTTFVLSHLLWIVAIAVGLIGFYSWKGEHDARLTADTAITSAQTQVQTLQQAIAARDKQTTAAVAPIVKIIHDTVTPAQAVAALPQVVATPLPAPIVPAPDNAVIIPEPDILPIFNQVADDTVCRQLLTTAQADIVSETAIAAQKDTEIVALKKKPSFWSRVATTAKTVGIGIGIGVVIGVVVAKRI